MGKCIAVKLFSQKSLFVALQFLYLEALDQDGTPSRTTARTPLSAKVSFVRFDPADWMLSADKVQTD